MSNAGISGLGEITKLIDQIIKEGLLVNGNWTDAKGNLLQRGPIDYNINIPEININNKKVSIPKANINLNQKLNRKSYKKKKSSKLKSTDIEKIIEEYIKLHPEVLQEHIKNYLKNNIRIDFKQISTTTGDKRFALCLYDKDKPFSTSTLALNIYGL